MHEVSQSGYNRGETVYGRLNVEDLPVRFNVYGDIVPHQELVMNRRNAFLKVKVKSLAAEAKIIRFEEHKTKGDLRNMLHEHRVGPVRLEARATHIAYGYLRGLNYCQIEPNPCPLQPAQDKALWDKVRAMTKKYGLVDHPSGLDAWREETTNSTQPHRQLQVNSK